MRSQTSICPGQQIGCLVLLGFSSVCALAQPSNDMFANRRAITGTNITAYGGNIGATREMGEPAHAGNDGGASVWWSWRAPASGPVQVSTRGSDFDTLLGVYTGSSVSLLIRVASNDDDPDASDYTSTVIFTATANVNYQIAVDGYDGDLGSITLKVQQPPPPPPPLSPAPAWLLLDPYGALHRSRDFAGKVVMFNFWGTTCGPCLAEMPDMIELQDKYRADGFVIIGADVSWWQDTPQDVIGFLATFTPTINYQIVMSTPANEAAFGGISAVPTTFIIDRDNLIRKKFAGSQAGAAFEREIVPLLYCTARLQCDVAGDHTSLCWPVTVKPFILESTASLVNPSWTTWPTQPVVINGTNTVQVPTTGNRYFRLRMPY